MVISCLAKCARVKKVPLAFQPSPIIGRLQNNQIMNTVNIVTIYQKMRIDGSPETPYRQNIP
jgi:hypothetical protein